MQVEPFGAVIVIEPDTLFKKYMFFPPGFSGIVSPLYFVTQESVSHVSQCILHCGI